MIQLFKPKVHQEAKDRVLQVLDSGWLGLGPVTQEFEEAFAAYVGAKHAIAFNSATAALQVAVKLSDIRPGFKVLTTPITFVSTNHVLLQEGIIPVFCDVDYFTGCISLESIKEQYEKNTDIRGIMVVHYGGYPCDLDEIYAFAKEKELVVIEDCAHAAGSKYKGRMIGSDAKFACFSFHAVKNLAVGDGGMITTNDYTVNEKAKKYRWLGIAKSTDERTKAGNYSWDYDVEYLGFKNHMNDITAALGLGQLGHLAKDNEYRRMLCDHYTTMLQPLDMSHRVKLQRHKEDRVSARHLMVVMCDSHPMRDFLMDYLRKHEIQTGMHYRPNYHYTMYKGFGGKGVCAMSEMFWRRAITLPLHLDMTKKDVEDVVATLEAGVLTYDKKVASMGRKR